MNEYIGLALVESKAWNKKCLFETPAWWSGEIGDEVVVDTKSGEQHGIVVSKATVRIDEEEFKMIVTATDATLPLKRVLKKVKYLELKYND